MLKGWMNDERMIEDGEKIKGWVEDEWMTSDGWTTDDGEMMMCWMVCPSEQVQGGGQEGVEQQPLLSAP